MGTSGGRSGTYVPVTLFAGAGALYKADSTTPVLSVTGAGTLSVKAGTVVVLASGSVQAFTVTTAVTTPALVAGTGYDVYAVPGSGGSAPTAQAVTAGSAGPAGALLIGGFHYAAGGNATGQPGGDTTPAINRYSCWDLKWRPNCPNPHGMALVANSFWADIYLTNTTTDALGTSAYGATIACGTVLPLLPAMWGGNGVGSTPDMNWWTSADILSSAGKRQPSVREFAALAYGVTEATSNGVEPTVAALDAPRTSAWGIMQATGVLWVWASAVGGPFAAASWSTAGTDGRGQVFNMPDAALLGGNWGNGANSGSRCSNWNNGPSNSNNNIGARGVVTISSSAPPRPRPGGQAILGGQLLTPASANTLRGRPEG
jgi:hypothetical protein